MILISIKSDLMDVKRQYETDKEAEKYLKWVEKSHRDYREYLGRMFQSKLSFKLKDREKVAKSREYIKSLCPLKVEIINTNANQLNFATQLK